MLSDYEPPFSQMQDEIRNLRQACGVLRTTLRDQFAMAALPAMLQAHQVFKDMAEDAYKIADAMMEARKEAP